MGIYVWIDVAMVYLICAVPFAMVLAGVVLRSLSRPAAFLLTGSLLALTLGVLNLQMPPHAALLLVLRTAIALTLAFSAALAWGALRGQRAAKGRPGVLALSMAVLAVVPCVYAGARSRHDVTQFGNLLEQSRLGEAHSLAEALAWLDPTAEWNGRPMPEITRELAKAVGELQSAVASPWTRDTTAEARLGRARRLAMLGRTQEALHALKDLDGPHANNLRGTIHEARGEWQAGLQAYETARKGWLLRADSVGLMHTMRGIGYCRQRLGQYPQAEAAYHELLKLAPNADTHFLLAQFYQDAQNAEQSRFHARQAMALDRQRYHAAGESLIRKLSVFQFGCWGVFSAEATR